MEAYQLKITKNYMPLPKRLHKKAKRYTATTVKIEDKSEQLNIITCKI